MTIENGQLTIWVGGLVREGEWVAWWNIGGGGGFGRYEIIEMGAVNEFQDDWPI
ncbi:MAG: hypothetical protein MI921_28610 [Cytophagales bacterium]|nr:hypothetical protein [Cytophagales bacterium]